jgi:hypothetical protein
VNLIAAGPTAGAAAISFLSGQEVMAADGKPTSRADTK